MIKLLNEAETTDQEIQGLAQKYQFTYVPNKPQNSNPNDPQSSTSGALVGPNKYVEVAFDFTKNSVVIQVANNVSLNTQTYNTFLQELEKSNQLYNDFQQSVFRGQ